MGAGCCGSTLQSETKVSVKAEQQTLVSDINEEEKKQTDKLVYVQILARHGDRTPIKLVNKDKTTEHRIWIPTLSHYTLLNTNKNSSNYETENKEITIDEIFSWTNISSNLSRCFLINTENNWDSNAKQININNNNTYTKDIKYDHPWCGQLTKKGVNESNEFGKYLRNKYSSYLEQAKLHCQSTNFARTIQTMDSILNGMYESDDNNVNQIPVHIDIPNCVLRFPSSKICPLFAEKSKENELYVSKKLGWDNEFIKFKKDFLSFYNREIDDIDWNYLAASSICRLENKLDLPPENVITEIEIKNYINYVFRRAMKIYSLDRDIMRLSFAVLINKFLNGMKNKSDTFGIISGHDETIMLLLIAITNGEEVDFKWPKYLSAVIFEVWEKKLANKNIERYVKVFYDKKIMKINGKECIQISELEQMWGDLIWTESQFLDNYH
eukprot:155758_1